MIQNIHYRNADESTPSNVTKSRRNRTVSLMIIFSLLILASVLAIPFFNDGNVRGDPDPFEIGYCEGAYFLEYTITSEEDEEVFVTGYSGDLLDNLNIPEEVVHNTQTYSVVGIEEMVFMKCGFETAIMDSVQSIGEGAFAQCRNLRTVNMDSVQSIGEGAFVRCESLQTISMDSVQSIGNYAFEGCVLLKTVNMDSVKSIGEGAFYYCDILETLNLGSVQNIGESAFANCNALTSLSVDNDNQYYSSSNGIIFSRDGKTLIAYPVGRTNTEYNVPSDVTTIYGGAFEGCGNLRTVNLGWVQSVEEFAFAHCYNLQMISMDSIQSIGEYAFYHCGLLETVNMDSAQSIGGYAFYHCGLLETVNLGSVQSIGEYAFYHCGLLETLNLGSVQSIGEGAFANCNALTSLSVDDDNQYYFSSDGIIFSRDGKTLIAYPVGRTNTEYNVPLGVTTIYGGAFEGCGNLRTINMNLVQSVGESAFEGCVLLETVNMYSVQSIGEDAFISCGNLRTVNMDSVQIIGARAFAYCGNLRTVNMDSVQIIEDWAFYRCASLRTVNVDSVQIIGDSAFYYCVLLETVNMGSVRVIVDRAFEGCVLLETVNMDSVKGIGDYAFGGCENLRTVNMDSVQIIRKLAFAYCENLRTVIMGSAHSIGESAFAYCMELKVIILPEGTSVINTGIEDSVIRIISVKNVRIDVVSVESDGTDDTVKITLTARNGFILDGAPSAKDADESPIVLTSSNDGWIFSIPVYSSDIRAVSIIQAVSESYNCTVAVIGNGGTLKYSLNGSDWDDLPQDGVIKVSKASPSLMIKAIPNEGWMYKWADGTPGSLNEDILHLTLSSDLSLTVTFSERDANDDALELYVIMAILVAADVGMIIAVYFLSIRRP